MRNAWVDSDRKDVLVKVSATLQPEERHG